MAGKGRSRRTMNRRTTEYIPSNEIFFNEKLEEKETEVTTEAVVKSKVKFKNVFKAGYTLVEKITFKKLKISKNKKTKKVKNENICEFETQF